MDDGTAYMPIGGGSMANRSSIGDVIRAHQLVAEVQTLEEACRQQAAQIADGIHEHRSVRLTTLQLRMALGDKGPTVTETQTGVAVVIQTEVRDPPRNEPVVWERKAIKRIEEQIKIR